MTSFVMACEGHETRKHCSAAQKLTQVNYHQNQALHTGPFSYISCVVMVRFCSRCKNFEFFYILYIPKVRLRRYFLTKPLPTDLKKFTHNSVKVQGAEFELPLLLNT